ncbi:TetR/AcrR family transcriptional regulator [Collinsella sp. zg1085]|uniref:TetR/AcrR family transcriptional regulator n=1 Tax=Collinsella sp. zg1085 TaxID=2844380 RepID=UPI001C0E175D|nr:TetR/AcrR family transcriptional regulator [Collinsella sp. zg1085]QWT17791.1 TetR/AcrR family transcriptional regulator [Collinsella sp. zg1085]
MDLRIQKTYRALNEAFTRLLAKRPYERIGVAALCDEAVIRRTTFYKHFRDKDDYLLFYLENVRREILSPHEHTAEDAHEDESASERRAILRRLTDFLLNNATIMDNILQSTMSGPLTAVICEAVADALRERYLTNDEPAQHDSRIEFAAGGITRLLTLWWVSEERMELQTRFIEDADYLLAHIMEK